MELHKFFEDWFNERIPETKESLNRLDKVLSAEFKMITPSANVTYKNELIHNISSSYGLFLSDDKPSSIHIQNMSGRMFGDSICLMTYEEWQSSENRDSSKGRLSSALFKKADKAPNSVQWCNLHEIWIP